MCELRWNARAGCRGRLSRRSNAATRGRATWRRGAHTYSRALVLVVMLVLVAVELLGLARRHAVGVAAAAAGVAADVAVPVAVVAGRDVHDMARDASWFRRRSRGRCRPTRGTSGCPGACSSCGHRRSSRSPGPGHTGRSDSRAPRRDVAGPGSRSAERECRCGCQPPPPRGARSTRRRRPSDVRVLFIGNTLLSCLTQQACR